ncbi:MAG: TlpA family protein disulfide reductase [Chloroflexi bacterium]|nr:TlpA family protein disulfide reductase [Chloroflexota bacterium]
MEPIPATTPHVINRYLRTSLVIVAALAGLILLVACGASGERARDFEVVQFNGETFRLSQEAESQVVVLNFWYPSCPPCREEMPAIEAAWQELKDEPVRILGLFVPQGFDSEQDAQDFVNELGLTFSFATDRLARIAEAYDFNAFPKTYYIDMDRNIVATNLGILETEEIVQQVRALIGDPAS